MADAAKMVVILFAAGFGKRSGIIARRGCERCVTASGQEYYDSETKSQRGADSALALRLETLVALTG
jgi:hypothetical protein